MASVIASTRSPSAPTTSTSKISSICAPTRNAPPRISISRRCHVHGLTIAPTAGHPRRGILPRVSLQKALREFWCHPSRMALGRTCRILSCGVGGRLLPIWFECTIQPGVCRRTRRPGPLQGDQVRARRVRYCTDGMAAADCPFASPPYEPLTAMASNLRCG